MFKAFFLGLLALFGTAALRPAQAQPSLRASFNSSSPKTDTLLIATTQPLTNFLFYSFTWKVTHAGVTKTVKTTENSSSNSDSLDLSLPGNGDKGDTIKVFVVGSVLVSGFDFVPVFNNNSVTVSNSAPVMKPIGLATWAGRNFLGRPESSDADGDFIFVQSVAPVGTVKGSISGANFNVFGNTDGLYLYNAPAAFSAPFTDTFRFTLSDGSDSSTQIAQISVGAAPVAGTKIYSALGASDVLGYGASDYDQNITGFSPALGYAPLLAAQDRLGGVVTPLALSRRAIVGLTLTSANRAINGQSVVSLAAGDGASFYTLSFGPNDVLYDLLPSLLSKDTGNKTQLDSTVSTYLSTWKTSLTQLKMTLTQASPSAKLASISVPDMGPGLMPLVALRYNLSQAQQDNLSSALTSACAQMSAHILATFPRSVDIQSNSDLGADEQALSFNPQTDLSGDGFHPNDMGYARLATRLFRQLNQQVAPTSGALISEFRLSGPGGARDEFIEIYNASGAPLDLTGWSVGTAVGTVVGASSIRATIPTGKIIPTRGHLLLTGTDYSLGGYAETGREAGDILAAFSADLRANSPLELRNAARTLVDSVNPGDLPAPLAASDHYSYLRRLDNSFPQDTDSDNNDFNLVDAQSSVGPDNLTGVSSGLRRLGVPGPENLSSPTVSNGMFGFTLPATPTVRVGSGNMGTLAIRRTLTNLSNRTVTALRLRVVALTAGTTSVPGSAPADLRLVSSASSDGVNLPLLLQSPNSQPNGGGLNSTLNLASLPGGGLAPGAAVTVEMLFNVVQKGYYRFLLNLEPTLSP